MNHHNHLESRIENPVSSIQYRASSIEHPESSIENPTLAHFRHLSSLYFTLAHYRHFRHLRHFSSLFTLSPLYICRESSTNQLLFMQNKPNLVRRRRIANSVCTMDYENFIPLAGQKNKPNSNPIKPNLRKAKMNINSFVTKDYRKKDDFAVRINKPNSKPIFSKPKMNVNLYVIEDYENETALRPQKTNPNKANFKLRAYPNNRLVMRPSPDISGRPRRQESGNPL